ncbi:MAG TPA: DUF4292 domain-containing protein [Ferruginibacter sp.]|nr:DUF4292 domain-containing protein [Ferruginibacter sp.]HMP22067.1 DUF4292 domain-containing protein [Ferruginibacter sp.]
MKPHALQQLCFLMVLAIWLMLGSSCKSTKKIQEAIAKKDSTAVHITSQSELDSILTLRNMLNNAHRQVPEYKTFSAKIKAEYEDAKGKQPNITVFVRSIKDSVIWLSGYATVFNIEAFRALITKDSVFIMDKINKEATLRSIDYLQEVSQIPFDFNTLQDLLVGNPVFLGDSIVSYKENEAKIALAAVGPVFKHLLTLSRTERNILHSKLDDLDIGRNRTADITYADYENANGYIFSTYREIIVSEKKKINIQLKFRQYEFNKELQVNFSIPKNYKPR